MSHPSSKPKDSLQAQVEALTAIAKKLGGEGKEPQALVAYQTASGLMLGAPWLQLRTAEFARKLQKPEVAALHFRRAAAAFIRAGFPKRALSPLRTAWQTSVSLLPNDVSSFVAVSLELSKLQNDLGAAADAEATLVNADQALGSVGSVERLPPRAEIELGAVSSPLDSDPAQAAERRSESGSFTAFSGGPQPQPEAAIKS